MKLLTIASLIAAQIAATAAPARAADLIDSTPASGQQMGSFVGARLLVPLDGGDRQARASIAAAPTLRSVQPSGEGRTRIGSGLELSFRTRSGPSVDFAGRPVSRLVEGDTGPRGRRANMSTVGWVAIGVGVAAVTVFLLYGLCGSGEICDVDDD